MRRRSCGCVCLFAIALCVVQPYLNAVCYAQEARGGEAIAVGGDAGEPVSDAGGGGGGSGVWKWIVGAGAVVIAGLGGYILADESEEDKDDAKKAADEAAASAAAAEAAAAADGTLTTKIYITGTFRAVSETTYNGGTNFLPSITFAVETASYPGGVIDYVSSVTAVASGLGGSYTQVSEKSLRVQVLDGFYLGKVTRVSATSIKLHNETSRSYMLYGVGDAHIWVVDL